MQIKQAPKGKKVQLMEEATIILQDNLRQSTAQPGILPVGSILEIYEEQQDTAGTWIDVFVRESESSHKGTSVFVPGQYKVELVEQ